jgi:dTDP-4-amino-4,6-dideoxygalactose transaminase
MNGNYDGYRRRLTDVPGVNLLEYDEREQANCQYIVCAADEGADGLARDELVQIMTAENVLAPLFFPGCHQMEPYRPYFPHAQLVSPETERLCRREMLPPTGAAVNRDTVSQVCRIIWIAIAHAAGVKALLAKTH